jgi:predicted transcriptional regulator
MCLQKDEIVVHPFCSISSIEKILIEKTYVVVKDEQKYYGILTPASVLLMGHQLAIDCITNMVKLDEDDELEKILMIMNNEKQYVLPVFSKENQFIGCTTYIRILEETGLLKRQPTEIKVTNIIGNYDIEMVKQSFIHELYHNIRNPLQIIHSSVNLYKATNNSIEKGNLLESIVASTNQVEGIISELFFSYFKTN